MDPRPGTVKGGSFCLDIDFLIFAFQYLLVSDVQHSDSVTPDIHMKYT